MKSSFDGTCSNETDSVEERNDEKEISSEQEVDFSIECIISLAKKSCSKEYLSNPVILNVVICIIFGIPTWVLFTIYPQYVLEFIIEHATLIQVLGSFVRILSKIIYVLAFLPLGMLYKFAIGVLDIKYSFVAALIYQAISTVCEVIAFKYHRVYGKLPDVQELDQFKKKIEKYRYNLDHTESDGTEKLVDDRSLSTLKKLLEIFMIQNAWGIPDTPTTIYFATATNWSIFIFAAATFASNFTIGLIKVTAWIIALRQVQFMIEENPDGRLSAWDLLLGLDDDLSLAETICITIVSGVGFVICVYRVCKFFWICCLRSRLAEWRLNRCQEENYTDEFSTSECMDPRRFTLHGGRSIEL